MTRFENMRANSPIQETREPAQESLDRLLSALHPERGGAWREYDRLRRKLVAYFENNRCPDAQELADEALERVAQKDDLFEIKGLTAYLFGVARYLRFESFRKALTTTSLDTFPGGIGLPADGETPELQTIEKLDMKRKLKLLSECLKHVSGQNRQLFSQYYFGEAADSEGDRARLAQSQGVSIGALRVRMVRIRQKLEECFVKRCGTSFALGNRFSIKGAKGEGCGEA